VGDLLEAIEAVRSGGSSRSVRCPAHDDLRASLSVSLGDAGRVLLYCHAGCDTEIILERSGLTWLDLRENPNGPHNSTRRPTTTRYEIRDCQGSIVAVHERVDLLGHGKRFIWRQPNGSIGLAGRRTTDLPLYGSHRLGAWAADMPIVIAEGERAADVLTNAGIAAVGTVTGASATPSDDVLRVLAGRHVVLWPDADTPGRAHMDRIAARLRALGHTEIRCVEWPDAPEHGDAADYRGDLGALLDGAPVYDSSHSKPLDRGRERNGRSSDDAETTSRGPSHATRLIELVKAEDAELWHTPTGEPYITLCCAAHREHYALTSGAARDWLSRLFYHQTRRALSASALADALTTLSSNAKFDGDEHAVFVRVAGHNDRIYLDLGDPEWRAVEVTRDGWHVMTDPPVRMRRSRGMLALPVPEHGGSIHDIACAIGLTGDDAILITAWLLGALRPTGPYPVLSLSGEQGAGKSTRARMIRGLIDPHEADLRAEPREVRDLMIAASSGWVVAFDNLSRVPDWFSDALCRVSTGGALGARTLYTDSDETILSAMRPIVLTGIAELGTRADLLDRCISLTLPTLDDLRRCTETDLWASYKRMRPRLLGALLGAVSCALGREPGVRLPALPRMADWTRWVTAAEPACGWVGGTVLRVYVNSRQEATETLLDGDLLAGAIRRLPLPWAGRTAELLTTITPSTRVPQAWPGSPRALSAALRRLAPSLRRVGISIVLPQGARTGRERIIRIEKVGARQDGQDTQDRSAHQLGASLRPNRLEGSIQDVEQDRDHVASPGPRTDLSDLTGSPATLSDDTEVLDL
jgi:hypothetical protein